MWLFTTDGFLSIVSKDCKPHQLTVRARVKADLKRAFPRAKITTSKPPADYRFRAVVTRRELAAYLGKMVEKIAYANFKDTVRDAARHDAYLRVWNALYALQERPTPSARRIECHTFGDGPLGPLTEADLFGFDDWRLSQIDDTKPYGT